MELGTLAAVQVPLLMFSVIWTNYLPLWRVQFLHLLFEGWGGPNDGFHTPFTFLPGEVLHGTSMQKAELLVEVGIASHSSIHPAFLAQPLPGIDPHRDVCWFPSQAQPLLIPGSARTRVRGQNTVSSGQMQGLVPRLVPDGCWGPVQLSQAPGPHMSVTSEPTQQPHEGRTPCVLSLPPGQGPTQSGSSDNTDEYWW